jgi:hypothetical protein
MLNRQRIRVIRAEVAVQHGALRTPEFKIRSKRYGESRVGRHSSVIFDQFFDWLINW